MRTGMRSRLILLSGVVAFCAAVYGYGVMRNPERATLDAAARAGVSGSFVTLGNGVTHYEIGGPDSGRVVVLVHGLSVPYYMWDSTFVRLTGAGYRVLRYDEYGRGWSDRPDVTYDGALYDAQLNELLDSLHITKPVDLVGNSVGGFVTAHFVKTHRARVRTLTLIDPVAGGPAVPQPLIGRIVRGSLLRLMRLPGIGRWLWNAVRVPGMPEAQLTDLLHPARFPTWADQYRTQMRYSGFGWALLSTTETVAATNLRQLYGAVASTGVPVLLIWGKQDRTVPFKISAALRQQIPAAEFMAVDSAGHLPHIEQAGLVTARLISFFESH